MSSIMINYALKQVGKPYRLGARGPREFDCSGLTLQSAAQIGLSFYHGATTQWNRGHNYDSEPKTKYGYFKESGLIETLPMDKVAFLFNQDKEKSRLTMAHTGLYDGAGWVVQAGGYGGRGVHYDPINKKRWSHWAILQDSWMKIDEEGDVFMGEDLRLSKGSVGPKVKEMQESLVSLGYTVGRTGADGKFGANTEKGVLAFQRDEGLVTTGIWTITEEDALDKRISSITVPKVYDDSVINLVLNAQGLIKQAEGMLTDAINRIKKG